jgi:hypothetical protein
MFGTMLTAMVLAAFAGALARPPQRPDSGFWTGKFEIFQYNFNVAATHNYRTEEDYISRAVELWTSKYDLYQNPGGTVREELTHMNRNRSVEGPLDIRLLDYDRNQAVVFDKGGDQEIKGPLAASEAAQDLGTRQILGFLCEGKGYRWKTFQGADVELQRWRARDSTLRVPLLEVEYLTDATGALLGMRVQVVSEVEPAPPLPAPLFEPPRGLKIVEVPSIE